MRYRPPHNSDITPLRLGLSPHLFPSLFCGPPDFDTLILAPSPYLYLFLPSQVLLVLVIQN